MLGHFAILRKEKIFTRSALCHSACNAGLSTSIDSTLEDISLPSTPSSCPPQVRPALFHRHRSIGSLASTSQLSISRRSEDHIECASETSRPQTPHEFERHVLFPDPLSDVVNSPSLSQGRPMSPSKQTYSLKHSQRRSKTCVGSLRHLNLEETMDHVLRVPSRSSPPQKPLDAPSMSIPISMLVPSTILSHITPDAPAMYSVTAIYPCEPPDGASYHSVLFFLLKLGDVYDVVAEAGHPSLHDGLPLDVDDDEDCLLLLRNVQGEIGWALASFLMPLL